MKKLDINKVLVGVAIILLITLAVMCVMEQMVIHGFAYSSDLGIYYEGNWHATIGEIKNGVVHYEYTHLNLMDIIRLW